MSEIVTAFAACLSRSSCDSPPSGTSDMTLLSKAASLVAPILKAPGSRREAVGRPDALLPAFEAQALTYRNPYRYISGNFRCDALHSVRHERPRHHQPW